MSDNIINVLTNIFTDHKIITEVQKIIISYFKYISTIINIYQRIHDNPDCIYDKLNCTYDKPDSLDALIVLYFEYVDIIKESLFESSKNIFDDIMKKHKCVMAPIFDVNSSKLCNEAVIYVPDLLPNKSPNDIDTEWIENATTIIHNINSVFGMISFFERFITKNHTFSIDWCEDFIIKNPIYENLIDSVASKITWQIYNSNHPILNLLLNDYIQCGALEHDNYYLIGFLSRLAPKPKNFRQKKITLVVPKRKNCVKIKSLNKIIKEFIMSAQNIKYVIWGTRYDMMSKKTCDPKIIKKFRSIMRNNNNFYHEQFSDIDIMTCAVQMQRLGNINVNHYSSWEQFRTYNLDFYMVHDPIINY